MKKTKKLYIEIPEHLHKEMRHEAAERDVPIRQVVAELVSETLIKALEERYPTSATIPVEFASTYYNPDDDDDRPF